MPIDYSQIITAYTHNGIDFDALKVALIKHIESAPESIPDVLAQLEKLKKTKPADLPLIQKLQRELRDYSPTSHAAAEPKATESAAEYTVIKGHVEPVEGEEHAKTVVKPLPKEIAEHDDATAINTETAGATLVQPPPAPPMPAPDEETRLQEPSEATRVESKTAGTDTSQAKKLEPGSVIKKRFVLESLLGEGGMGRVFKARDRRKEEAHDRNPYVAIKVLNDTFKEHPQAFIALQREAKKAQTLAHPNIVNVYDFDRDGDTVYMTMEYLEGDSLDRMIRQLRPNPFKKPDAIKIIQGICLGLSYAHKRNIIHSDLKPGNVFVTSEGEVKIFDFGIARAIKSQDVSGEKTLFDAGSLGGLTPAYASCEMFEGEEPDVRDDIYALACIAYEMLGGKHPFNKTPAIKAKQNHLIPDKLPHLSRRQNKTLNAGLAFDRQARIRSVDLFIEALTTRFTKRQKITMAVAVMLMITAIISYEPLANFYREQQIENYVARFETGNTATIQAALKKLAKLPHALRDEILTAAKEPLIAYYVQQSLSQIDIDKGLVDFSSAYRQLNIANALYPDSAQVSAAKKKLQQREQQLSNELTTRLSFHLQQGNLLPDDNSDDVLDVLAMAAKIDPQHPLLTDKRIAVEYAKQAQNAANQWDFDKAQKLLEVAQKIAPGNTTLANLQQNIDAQQQQYLARQEKIAGQVDAKSLRREVDLLLSKPFDSPNWSRNVQTAIAQLDVILPANDSWLQNTKQQIALFHLKRSENLRRQGKFGEARSVIQLAEKFNPHILGLKEEKSTLKVAEERALQQQQIQAQQQQTSEMKQQLLREANNNNVEKAENLFQQLTTALDKNDPFVQTDAPDAIAAAYTRLGNNALQRGEAESAAQWVAAGLKIAPQHQGLTALKAKLPKKSSDACDIQYAGYGKRMTCHDTIGADKGPLLVVIPAPSAGKAFAIGKYETSIAEFNAYCQATKSCSSRDSNGDLPITNVSINEINSYLQWLSAQSGAIYRLPTKTEWTHAAKATAQPAGKDFNCRVMIGDNIVRGNALLDVNSGAKNSWGLINYVGNVQELVFDTTNQLLAMGGAYQDPLTQCTITFSRKHDGKPDSITGFRVLREL
jgi:hypothetical protein